MESTNTIFYFFLTLPALTILLHFSSVPLLEHFYPSLGTAVQWNSMNLVAGIRISVYNCNGFVNKSEQSFWIHNTLLGTITKWESGSIVKHQFPLHYALKLASALLFLCFLALIDFAFFLIAMWVIDVYFCSFELLVKYIINKCLLRLCWIPSKQ